MKKSLKTFLLALMLLFVCSFSVSAKEDEPDFQDIIGKYEQDGEMVGNDYAQSDPLQIEYNEANGFPEQDDFSEIDEGNGVDALDLENVEEVDPPEPIRPMGVLPEPEIYMLDERDPEEGTMPQIDYDETELYFELEARVKKALLAGETTVDISELYIDPNKYSGYSMYYFSPYFSNGIEFVYYSWTNRYSNIKITNPMSLSETKLYFRKIDAKIDEIMQLVTPDMSDEIKALIIHDYLVYESEYDYDRLQDGTIPSDSYKCGGIIMTGTGVCQAYSDAYRYIMNRLGIECYVTGNSDMHHVWNIINIEGSYYHVDCTWDDPVYDRWGNVGHTYFLLSDQAIQEKNHYGWNLTNYVCNNLNYDNAYWHDIESNIIIQGNNAYYISKSERSINSRELSSGATEKLKELERWKVWGSSASYGIPYSGLLSV